MRVVCLTKRVAFIEDVSVMLSQIPNLVKSVALMTLTVRDMSSLDPHP